MNGPQKVKKRPQTQHYHIATLSRNGWN